MLLEARDEENSLGPCRQLAVFDVIVLDELNYVPATKADVESLFGLVRQAYDSFIQAVALPASWKRLR
ncbi:MAG: hypothetical protein CMJ58_01420 [Planctomycetaceae bacterium]|nr:hypothetical protein [Planctomycetaceae bacterium]